MHQMRFSSSEIYTILQESYNGLLTNTDTTYGVINCNELKQKSKPKQRQISSNLSYADYMKSLMNSNDIDPDEYNLLKEVKLRCLSTYFNNTIDNRKISIELYDNIGSIDIENGTSVCNLLSGDMNSYHKYINNDVAFIVFANKRIGGLAFTTGCAQEEIKMFQSPELLLLKIKQYKLEDNQIIIVKDVKNINSIIGYGFDIEISLDNNHGYKETIVFMDSINYSKNVNLQFKKEYKDRELTKCLTAFSNIKEKNIITSDWGTGAFRSNHHLKFMIQLYCARISNKNLYYFSNRITKDIVGSYSNKTNNELLECIYTFAL